jgi:hypothetical protein
MNHLIDSGQKKKIVNSTKNRVKEVNILLLIVSFIEILIISNKPFQFFHHLPQKCFKFDLILSKTTIVSLIEYHNIVNNAVIKNVSILNSGKYIDVNIYAQVLIIISWNNVIIVIKEKEKILIHHITHEKAYVT